MLSLDSISLLLFQESEGFFMDHNITEQFSQAAEKIGAMVLTKPNIEAAVRYIAENSQGTVLVPKTALSEQYGLHEQLVQRGVEVFQGPFREAGQIVGAGITFSNFCLADSGTVVLDSSQEEIRLATTLPEKHFIIVDPATILEDNLAAAPPMQELHLGHEPKFIAYITGPSRTADIERILTIGCHGPRELHILLVDNISSNLLEN